MGIVRAISLRLRKRTTAFPRQGNRQIHDRYLNSFKLTTYYAYY